MYLRSQSYFINHNSNTLWGLYTCLNFFLYLYSLKFGFRSSCHLKLFIRQLCLAIILYAFIVIWLKFSCKISTTCDNGDRSEGKTYCDRGFHDVDFSILYKVVVSQCLNNLRNTGDKTRGDIRRNVGAGLRKTIIKKLRGQTKVRSREQVFLVLDLHPPF